MYAESIVDQVDAEFQGYKTLDARIEAAADRAMRDVDAETVGLFRKYGLPLPARLTKTTWGD